MRSGKMLMIIIPLMRDYKKGKGVNIEGVGKERE